MAITLRSVKGSKLTQNEVDNNFDELDKIPNGKVFPKTSGIGIKIDTLTPDFGWKDLLGVLRVDGDVDDAVRVPYLGGIKAVQFAEGKEAYIDFHIPHDYVPGSTIYIHVHWSHNSPLVISGSTTWGFEIMYAKGYDQAQFQTPVIVSVVQNVVNTPYTHQIAETVASIPGGSSVLLDSDQLEVDGIIQCRIYLDSNDLVTSDGSIVNPFAHFADIHYQSTGITTKGRNFPFYT